MSLVRGYARGASWVMAHWRRPHRDEPEQLPMPRTGDEPAPPPPCGAPGIDTPTDKTGRRAIVRGDAAAEDQGMSRA